MDTIEELKTKLKDYEDIISVYAKDKEDSLNAQLNSIAKAVKIDYEEFKEAEDLEMTIEIGEILRDQLKHIFKALKRAGIRL